MDVKVPSTDLMQILSLLILPKTKVVIFTDAHKDFLTVISS